MKKVTSNPFRLLGVLVGSGVALENSNKRRIVQYLHAEQEIPDRYGKYLFDDFHGIEHSEESVNHAAAELNNSDNRFKAAMFWFMKSDNNHMDEVAFDRMVEGNYQDAYEIWEKQMASPISLNNMSAYLNKSTIDLFRGVLMENIEQFSEGVQAKLTVLDNSTTLKALLLTVNDENYQLTSEDAQVMFLEELKQDKTFSRDELNKAISNLQFKAKKKINQNQSIEITKQINGAIRKALSSRSEDSNGFKLAVELEKATSSSMLNLKDLLGNSDLQYKSLSDKLADSYINLAINYFNNNKEEVIPNFPSNMKKILSYARRYAIGGIVKERIADQGSIIEENLEYYEVAPTLRKINKKFESTQTMADTVSNALSFLRGVKPLLSELETTLHNGHEKCLEYNTIAAQIAQQMCVIDVNKEQKSYDVSIGDFDNLRAKVATAWQVSNTIDNMDLIPEFRTRANENKAALRSMKADLAGSSTRTYTGSSSSGNSNLNIPRWVIYGGIFLVIWIISKCQEYN